MNQGSSVEIDEQTQYNCVARIRERGLTSVFGNIRINRSVYTEFYSGGIKSFIDEELDIEDKRKSPLVRYWSSLLGTVTPFDEAKLTLEKIRGIEISAKQIEIIEQIIEQLRDKQQLLARKQFVDDKLRYFMNNKQRMRFDMFKKQGLCIGSGAIESANKYVIQRRLKMPGMKWNENNANYMVHLRAEYINGYLENHFNLKHNALIEGAVT